MQRIATVLLLTICGCAGSPLVADPNNVLLAGALSNTHLQAGSAGELSARLRIEVQALKGVARPPVNVALAIDTSGSMEGNAIRDARDAALALLDAMSDGDRLALVAFDSETRVLVPSTQIDRRELAELREQIGKMEARGTTDLGGGLQAAIAEVMNNAKPNGINRVVLLSDGIPNDQPDFLAIAERARQNNIAITALGLGLEYDETLLAGLAAKSGGTFRFLEDSSLVAKIFEEEVFQLKRVIAKNTKLVIKPGPGIGLATIPGIPVSVGAQGQLIAALGDLSENDKRDVFVELSVAGRRDGANIELIDAVLVFQDALSSLPVEKRVFLSARATSDSAAIEKSQNLELKLSLTRARIAAWTVDAIALARSGRTEDAQNILERAEATINERAAEWNTDELADEVKSMRLVRQALPTYAESSDDARNVRRAHDRAVKASQGSAYESSPVTW